jgi:HD-GYP domain-containing protein (c-di-GMP phosphodiesterase class II)
MLEIPINSDVSDSPLSGYVPVRIAALLSIDTTAVDLFLQYERGREPVLYCRSGARLDQQQFLDLVDSGIERVYVRRDDFHQVCNNVLEVLEKCLQQDTVPQTEKFAALQVAFAVEIEESMRLIDSGRIRSLAERISRDLVTLFATSEVLPRDLFRIAMHDFNTFTHVTNVASYSIILAEQLGIHDRPELEQIATGAMLHDIGKRFIPAAILAKNGPLDPEERELVETHPLRGYEELCDRPGLSFGQLMMVYQHHEHVDGSGYPVKILDREIHPWAKLLTVVDRFDAMTAKRPYRRSATLEFVIDYQRQRAGTVFDREVVECWILAMSKTGSASRGKPLTRQPACPNT